MNANRQMEEGALSGWVIIVILILLGLFLWFYGIPFVDQGDIRRILTPGGEVGGEREFVIPNPFVDPGEPQDTGQADLPDIDAPDLGLTTDEGETGITVAKILENPSLYQGLEVQVDDTVNEWVSRRAFILDGPGVIQDTIMVIQKEEFNTPQAAGETSLGLGQTVPVRVIGTVRVTTVEELSNLLGVQLSQDEYGDFVDTPVIVATKVEVR